MDDLENFFNGRPIHNRVTVSKSSAAREFFEDGGVSIRTRIFPLVNGRKLIACAGYISICTLMRHSCRSILMNGWLKLLIFTLGSCAVAVAADNLVESTQASKDAVLETNPASAFWRAARHVYMDKDTRGNVVQGYRTEVRTRWTTNNFYLLFICPYEELYLKDAPNTVTETNQLWNWDVAEVFIGSDFQDIKRYKEFELSPQGEWSTWISISTNHATKMVGPGIRISKSPRALIVRRRFGMER